MRRSQSLRKRLQYVRSTSAADVGTIIANREATRHFGANVDVLRLPLNLVEHLEIDLLTKVAVDLRYPEDMSFAKQFCFLAPHKAYLKYAYLETLVVYTD
jgi:hypothetical protein